MRHGSIRLAVIGSVFRLRRFTVPALCQDSGLGRKQVYRILGELEKQNYLTKITLTQEKRKAERPLSIYSLVEDAAFKAKLMDEFAPSLRLARALENRPEPDSLLRARATLDAVGKEIEALGEEPASLPLTEEATRKLHKFEQKLDGVAEDLEIVLLRMGLVQNKQLPTVIETELQRLEKGRTLLKQVRARFERATESRGIVADYLASSRVELHSRGQGGGRFPLLVMRGRWRS